MRAHWIKKALVTSLLSAVVMAPAMAEQTLKMAYALSKTSHYGVAADAFE